MNTIETLSKLTVNLHHVLGSARAVKRLAHLQTQHICVYTAAMKLAHAEDCAQTLREKGLRATPKRYELLSLLAQLKVPMSASEIKAQWPQGEIDTVTLYRALEALAKAGLVRRVDLQHGHADYELATRSNHHHHLVCTDCGAIEDVTACAGKTLEKTALKHSTRFASLREHSLEFFGTCNSCAA